MKSTGILVKTSALILGFTLVLGVGILSLSFSHGGARRNEDTFLTPEHAVAPPTAQELLQKKFEVYNTVTEEDGKSVVTIFSEEQIADIRTRRENGEWFWLSSEEMLYLINDTVKLFEEYDVVYIRDLEGKLNKYYGLSFFSSEEYYASFGGFDLGVTDASFDLKKDVYETILERAQTLNSATAEIPDNIIYLYLDIEEPLTDQQIANMAEWKNPFWNSSKQFGVVSFEFDSISYFQQSPKNDAIGSVNKTTLYSRNTSFDSIGYYKFDRNSEKVVVVELREENSQKLIARLRFDSKTDLSILMQFEDKYKNLLLNQSKPGIVEKIESYRVVIYFNGFVANDQPTQPIKYCPVGNLDLFCYEVGAKHEFVYLIGSNELAKFTNDLIYEYLSIEF